MNLNKRGQDFRMGVTVLATVFVFAIVGVIILKILSSVNTEVQANDAFNSQSKTMMSSSNTKMINWLDNSILFVYVGFSLVIIIFAVLTFIHPIFFLVSMIMVVLQVLSSRYFSHMWSTITSTSELSGTVAGLINADFFINSLPYFTLIFAVIISIISYSKFRA